MSDTQSLEFPVSDRSSSEKIQSETLVFTMTRLCSLTESTTESRIRLNDPRVLALNLFRPEEADRRQVEASPVIVSSIRCATTQEFLGTDERARAAAFYTTMYDDQNAPMTNSILPALYMVSERRRTKLQEKNDLCDTQHWLTQVLNNFGSMFQFSDVQIANSLMGIESFHSSHKFCSFHTKSFVDYQRNRFFEGKTQSVAPDIDTEMHDPLPPDGTMDNGDRDRVTQYEYYLHRGKELKDLSPYEWTAIIRVETDEVPTQGTRFLFDDDGTSWRDTRRQVLRKKFVILHCDAFRHSFDIDNDYQSPI